MDIFKNNPSVVIVSSSNIKPKSLIKLITRETEILDDKDPNKVLHPWKIDTKYYTAYINLFGINENYIRDDEFNRDVQALVIHMDSNKVCGLEDLKKWEIIEQDCEPEIKILVSNYCTSETKITKMKATEWCLKRGYELIELYPAVDKNMGDDSDEDIVKEKTGVDRIIEALHTHIWPNLVMKKRNHGKVDTASQKNESLEDGSEQSTTHDKTNEDVSVDEFLTEDGIDDFTDLFSQIHMMKESIQAMPTSQRKQCAEHMVSAFWKAIGGDEEEVADI